MSAPTPRLRMFAGPNGSGKSTIKEVIPDEWLGIYINPDEIEKGIRRDGFLSLADFSVATTGETLFAFLNASQLLAKANLLDQVGMLTLQGQRVVFGPVTVNSYWASVLADFMRHQLLAAADAMAQARGTVLSRWQATPHAGPALARLAVRTSMRNQLPCVVEHLVPQGQIVGVHLRLGWDQGGGRDGAGAGPVELVSRITRESAELLGLRPGLALQALCKATGVRVERVRRGAVPAMGPGAHGLRARATRVVRGASDDEVSAELDGGLQMVGFAAPGSGLRVGSPVVLVVEDHAVVLALADL